MRILMVAPTRADLPAVAAAVASSHQVELLQGEVLERDLARAAGRAYLAGLRAAEAEGVPGVQGMTLGDYQVQYGSEQSGGVSGGGMLGSSAAPMLLPSEKRMLDRYRYVSA